MKRFLDTLPEEPVLPKKQVNYKALQSYLAVHGFSLDKTTKEERSVTPKGKARPRWKIHGGNSDPVYCSTLAYVAFIAWQIEQEAVWDSTGAIALHG